jgi:serine/threonine protein kinase
MSRGIKTRSRISELDRRNATDESGHMDWFDEESDEDSLIGQAIDGRYQVLSLIGRGGMGSVYKAEHIGIHRVVALKLLHPSLASVPEVKSRFEREAFAIGRIEHPNCVNVSDFGKLDDGSLYLVMEYLEGRSLGDEMADMQRLEPTRALHILQHVLRGLGHAHENDIVHRDVKPENVVLVEQDGDPDFAKILDFGIAKLIGTTVANDGGVKLTQAGMAFGTPIYMSPEQAVGNPVDGRADLYAASVMAYEMITGQPPFQSDDKIEVMSMHTTRPVPPMSEIASGLAVPMEIEQVIARGLAKRPKERYLNAAEYIDAINTVMGGGSMPPIGVQHYNTNTSGPHAARMVALPMQTQGTQQLAELADSLTRQSQRTRRFVTVALMLAAVVGIGIAIAASMQQDSSDDQSALAERAEEALESGEPKKAIELLKQDEGVIKDDAGALLQLGHAYAKTRADKEALAQYRAAIAIDRNIRKDGELRANLRVLLDGKDLMIALDAADFLATYMDDEPARAKLVEFASKPKKTAVRHKAVALVEALGLGERIDRVASYLLDLSEESRCGKRRDAVEKLRMLGDKRAIPALKKAAVRKRKGKKINRCLAKEALAAVEYLTSLPPDDAKADSSAP